MAVWLNTARAASSRDRPRKNYVSAQPIAAMPKKRNAAVDYIDRRIPFLRSFIDFR
jgi:hypothetical protein